MASNPFRPAHCSCGYTATSPSDLEAHIADNGGGECNHNLKLKEQHTKIHLDKQYTLDEFFHFMDRRSVYHGHALNGTLSKSDLLHLAIEAAEALDCADCAICAVDCCDIDEYYLVHDDLWKEFGVVHGMLCVGCLEQRMGRQLTPADFKERVGINGPDESRSARLESRMTPALQIATPPIA